MTPGINTLLLSTGALGSFTCSGMTLPIYMGPTALRGIRATGDTLSNVESQVFTPYKFGSTAGDRTPDLLTTRTTCYQRVTTRHIYICCLLISLFTCTKSGNIYVQKYRYTIRTGSINCDTFTQPRYTLLFKLKLKKWDDQTP